MSYSKEGIFDYIIVGNGASTALLLLALNKRGLLSDKRILIIDKATKNTNDRTFCFWAKEDDPMYCDLKTLIDKSWKRMIDSDGNPNSIEPYSYHCIRSLKLYELAQSLQSQYQIEVLSIHADIVASNSAGRYVVCQGQKYFAKHIFDSRPPDYFVPSDEQVFLLQSFVGWFVRVEQPIKNPDAIHWMDFDVDQGDNTQFMYVLPLNSQFVLVEYTRFGHLPLTEEEAFPQLYNYIQKRFGEFEIEESEIASIPMTNCEMSHRVRAGVTLMGARAGHLKPTTGYAFSNMYEHAADIALQIERNSYTHSEHLELKTTTTPKRFQFYDALLLIILSKWPHQGKPLFMSLLGKIKIPLLLRFLSHETHLKEEITIFYQLPWKPFLKALMVWFIPYLRITGISAFIILYVVFRNAEPLIYGWAMFIMLLGLICIGIPHGALDHVIESSHLGTKKFIHFLGLYLLLMGLMSSIWFYNPNWALCIFLVYSAIHFGQTDGVEWELSNFISWLWGASMLAFILGSHDQETNIILESMGFHGLFPTVNFIILAPWFLYASITKRGKMVGTILWIGFSCFLPLIFAFGLYFIFHHSALGWKHLKSQFNMTHSDMWRQSVLFQLGAWLFLSLFYLYWPSTDGPNNITKWGVFFVFLSSLSFPHVLAMIRFYKRNTKTIM
ncbi:MAG: hypothetical protein FJX95_07770 [Bacteroidetes bacterium]|nr:hypothetical protein [Bacteroidota bacterium]